MSNDVARGARRVLIIEDDDDIRSVLREALQDAGYETQTATNGRDALGQLAAGPRPEVILLDLMMPEVDGWAFRDLQLRDPGLARIPVIVMSAGMPNRAPPEGSAGYIRKPFDLDTLVEEVERVLGSAATEEGVEVEEDDDSDLDPDLEPA